MLKTRNTEVEVGGHVVHFYEDEVDLVAAVTPYLAAGLHAGEVAIVIATAAHRTAFQAGLEAGGVDVFAARADERYVALDAADTMAGFLVDGAIDRDRFDRVIGGLIGEAARSGRSIRIYGEMVALLWEAGDVVTAVELEGLWNELAGELPFSLFCSYSAMSVAGSEHADALHQVCQLHSSVVDSHPADISASFTADHGSPGDARRMVVAALREAGYAEDLLETVSIVVSELASNAVRHADSPFEIVVRREAELLRVAVKDGGPIPGVLEPQRQHGLGIISAFAVRWGVEPTAGGKVVWAELAL